MVPGRGAHAHGTRRRCRRSPGSGAVRRGRARRSGSRASTSAPPTRRRGRRGADAPAAGGVVAAGQLAAGPHTRSRRPDSRRVIPEGPFSVRAVSGQPRALDGTAVTERQWRPPLSDAGTLSTGIDDRPCHQQHAQSRHRQHQDAPPSTTPGAPGARPDIAGDGPQPADEKCPGPGSHTRDALCRRRLGPCLVPGLWLRTPGAADPEADDSLENLFRRRSEQSRHFRAPRDRRDPQLASSGFSPSRRS